VKVTFFQTHSGTEPVREWLKSLPAADRKTIGKDIQAVQISWPVGMPLVKSLGNGLWEVRSHLPHGIARVIFLTWQNQMVLLHGFLKKTQKIPNNELDLAKQRQHQFLKK
jgi:phage-related protein